MRMRGDRLVDYYTAYGNTKFTGQDLVARTEHVVKLVHTGRINDRLDLVYTGEGPYQGEVYV